MIEVVRTGQCVTVQDEGRIGYRSEGVPESGALVHDDFELANVLVGNPPNTAAFEIYGAGPTLRFHVPTVAALTGVHTAVNSSGEPLPLCRPVWIEAGEVLRFSFPQRGMTSYLAIQGGILVNPVLNSRSTDTANHLGGIEGRTLSAGDRIPVAADTCVKPTVLANWQKAHLRPRQLPAQMQIRLIKGPDAALYPALYKQMLTTAFTVSPNSNRAALRVRERLRTDGADLSRRLSEGTVPGTIQLLPDGDILIHLADGPVSGGYPVLGVVAVVDLPHLAQLAPGTPLSLREVSLPQARAARKTQYVIHQRRKQMAIWCNRRGAW